MLADDANLIDGTRAVILAAPPGWRFTTSGVSAERAALFMARAD